MWNWLKPRLGRLWRLVLILAFLISVVGGAVAFRLEREWRYGWGGTWKALWPDPTGASDAQIWRGWKWCQMKDLEVIGGSLLLIAGLLFLVLACEYNREARNYYGRIMTRRRAAAQQPAAGQAPAAGGTP